MPRFVRTCLGMSPTAAVRSAHPNVRLCLLAAAFVVLLTTCPALAQTDKVAGEGASDKAQSPPKPDTPSPSDDKKDENGKDKEKNGDDKDKDKDKKEEMQKILQLVAEGKMTVEQALAKMAEKTEEKKEDKEDKDNDKDKEDKDKEDKCKLLPEGWNFHAQTTIIPSFDAGFGAKYSGPNSLGPEAQRTGTISADLYLGVPLWHGAEFHADLLLWQGFGLSNTFGLEAFPDTDAYKAGTVDPRFMFVTLLCSPNLRPGRGTGGRARRPLHATRQTGRFAINHHRWPDEHGGHFRQ